MSTYRISVIWQMYGHIDIEAESEQEAIEKALGPEFPLPDCEYVDGPIRVDEDLWIEVYR